MIIFVVDGSKKAIKDRFTFFWIINRNYSSAVTVFSTTDQGSERICAMVISNSSDSFLKLLEISISYTI
jgi:hypothetical protein